MKSEPDQNTTPSGPITTRRPAWGHVARRCVHCGKVGPRVIVAGGWAHRYCIKKAQPMNEAKRRG